MTLHTIYKRIFATADRLAIRIRILYYIDGNHHRYFQHRPLYYLVFFIAQILLVMTAVKVMVLRFLQLSVSRLTYIMNWTHLKWTRSSESGEYVARNVVTTLMAMRHDGVFCLGRNVHYSI